MKNQYLKQFFGLYNGTYTNFKQEIANIVARDLYQIHLACPSDPALEIQLLKVLDGLESPDSFKSKDLPNLKKMIEGVGGYREEEALHSLANIAWFTFGFLPSFLKGSREDVTILKQLQEITSDLTRNAVKEELRRRTSLLNQEEESKEDQIIGTTLRIKTEKKEEQDELFKSKEKMETIISTKVSETSNLRERGLLVDLSKAFDSYESLLE